MTQNSSNTEIPQTIKTEVSRTTKSFGKVTPNNLNCLGPAHSPKAFRVLLLGSGELGKELCIEFHRLGIEVIACDAYADAPAMQVAHGSKIFSMTDAKLLRAVVEEVSPDLIVPEIEAIATEELLRLEEEGYRVAPNARATVLTMNREGIRTFASKELGLPTAAHRFANTFPEFVKAAEELGFPCYVKPLMSSSGKGQSRINHPAELAEAWDKSQTQGRTGKGRVIVEAHVPFESEITMLTVRSPSGTLFCDPIGHVQKEGDYVESWQPHPMTSDQIARSQEIAAKITEGLGGFGVFGVELFLLKSGEVLFSEVSPRPHDTGLVTLCTQHLSEFALHARAVLGLPLTELKRHSVGASVALRSDVEADLPVVEGLEKALGVPETQIRIFGKPKAFSKRRMGVVLANGGDTLEALERARLAHSHLKVTT